MKSVKETLEQRVSCRRYEREPLTDSQIEGIYAAIRNTPTSFNGQNYTVIDIDDQPTKESLYALTNQKQIKTCARFLVFCADFNKICVGADAKGIEMPPVYNTFDGAEFAIMDATLAMMSAIVAAESMGLGTCPIGYTRTAAPAEISEILKLPQHVMVVCGLAIGVPREHNDLKPKQPEALLIHRNHYRTDSLAPEILDYDAVVTHYNATRSGNTTPNDWVGHMISYYRESCSLDMLKAVAAQGFDIKK